MQRESKGDVPLWIVVKLSGSGPVDLGEQSEFALPEGMRWWCILSTEDPALAPSPTPIRIETDDQSPTLVVPRAGAVVLKPVPVRPESTAGPAHS